MVVAELDIKRVAVHEPKADSPLIIHRYRMLTLSISGERVEPIAWRYPEVIEIRGQINILQLSRRSLRHVRRYAPTLARGVKLLRTSVRERLYHRPIVTRHVTRGKCGVGDKSLRD